MVSARPVRRAAIGRVFLGLAALVVSFATGASASDVVVVDMQRVLREAAVAVQLRQIELEERRALRARLDAITEQLRTEEAYLTDVRDSTEREQFDAMVEDFDRRVREARQEAQETSASFQSRFSEAFAALDQDIVPVIADILDERGASLALDRRSVLIMREDIDITREVIDRLDAALPADVAHQLLPRLPEPR